MGLTAAQSAMVQRVRGQLNDDAAVREVSMFGGRAIMVDEAMLVSVGKDGGLLVRVDPDRHDELLTEPGAIQAHMGAGRSMGPGWVSVSHDVLDVEDRLQFWIAAARARPH